MVKRKSNNLIGIILIVAGLIAIVAVLVILLNESKQPNVNLNQGNNSNQESQVNWVEYVNQDYSFSLSHPDTWKVFFDDEGTSPIISVYPEGDSEEAYEIFENRTHFSVYPKGLASEGIFGQTGNVVLSLGEEINSSESRAFILENGQAFAFSIRPQEKPQSWSEAGFVFARNKVDNLQITCLRGDTEVDQSTCDPLVSGDSILHDGSVDEETWQILQRIAGSFVYTESAVFQSDIINLNQPQPEDVIDSPLVIRGQAKGPWYFEATFPIVLTNWDGLIIAEGFATAQDDWMTEDFVPFLSELEFDSPYSEGDPDFMKRGSLILQKSNPSGLPENDDALEITVFFAE